MIRPVRLTVDHLPHVIDLHRRVVADQPPGLVAVETDRFFADHLERLGRIYGLFEDRRLIAYGVLGLPASDSPNFGADHGLPAEHLPKVAHIDGIAVAPDRRGLRLHRVLIQHRLQEAGAAGRTIALSTAAPGNLPSLANLLTCGLAVRGLIDKFGGKRYLLRRDLDAAATPSPDGEWLAIDDLDGQRERLSKGLVAWRLDRRARKPRLFYAHPVEEQRQPPASAPEPAMESAGVRRAKAEAIIERHAAYSAVGGVLPLPFLDTIGVVAANLRMVKALADLHDIPFHERRAQAVIVSVIGGLLPTGAGAIATAVLARLLPGAGLFGMAVSGAAATAITRAVGEAYLAHFETGEPLALPVRISGRRAATA